MGWPGHVLSLDRAPHAVVGDERLSQGEVGVGFPVVADPVDFLLGALQQHLVQFCAIRGLKLPGYGTSFRKGGVVHVRTHRLQVPGDGVRELRHRQLRQGVILLEGLGLGGQEHRTLLRLEISGLLHCEFQKKS